MKHFKFKNLIYALGIFIFTSFTVNSQTINWTQTYGASGQDGGESMVLTDNGEIVIAGFKSTNNTKDVLLMKTDANGNEVWSRIYNIGVNDWGRDLKKTQDGGYIIAGMAGVSAQTYDPFLIKTDSEGNMLWYRTYDYGFGEDDRGHAVWQTSDGGYVIAGQTIIIHGVFANYDMYIIKTDANGNVQWTRIFYRQEEDADVALGVQQLNDGGYIVGGFTHSSPWSAYVLRLDSLGNPVWSNIYPGEWQSECYDIQSTPDGGFLLTGTESSFTTDTDFLIIKLNADGNLLWKKIYGTDHAEIGYNIKQLNDGGFIFAGMSSQLGGYDMYVVRTNSTGDLLWSQLIGGTSDDRAFAIASAQNGIHFVTGWAYSYGQGQGDVYLVKLTESPSGISQNNFLPAKAKLQQNYPNPFNPVTNIKFEISENSNVRINVYDVSGKLAGELLNKSLSPGNYEVNFDGSNYSSGIYFYTLTAGAYTETKSMMLIK